MRKKNRGWRAAAAALIFSLLWSGAAWTATAESGDIQSHWAAQTLQRWTENGLLSGYADGSYHPDQPVTRAEFITLANRAYKLNGTSGAVYSDVEAGKWYAPEIGKAAAAAYISGYEDGTMRPMKNVTRQEAALMLSRLAKLDAAQADTAALGFTDVSRIGGWSRNAVAAVSERNWLSGYPDGSFQPERDLTRAEAVVALDRSMEAPAPAEPVADTVYKEAGTYGPSSGTEEVTGDVVIAAAGVTLQNTVIHGNLTLEKGIGEGDVQLKKVIVQGTTTVHGGGANSVHLVDSAFNLIIVDKPEGTVRLVLEGTTTVEAMQALTQMILLIAETGSIEKLEAHAFLTMTGQGVIVEAVLFVPGSTFERAPQKVNRYPPEPNPGSGSNIPFPGGGAGDPVPVITGVQDGQTYLAYVTPASTSSISSAVLEKDGAADASYKLGDMIKESGEYVLTLTGAGGKSTVSFSLRADASLTALEQGVSYKDHLLTVPLQLRNSGADFANAVNTLKLSVSGLADDVQSLPASASSPDHEMDFVLKRDGDSDDFIAMFPPSPYTLTQGWDHAVTYTVDLGLSLHDRPLSIDAWVGRAAESSQQAVARLQTINITAEADPAAPIADLAVTAKAETAVDVSFTQPLWAEHVSLEQSGDDGESWTTAATSEGLSAQSAAAQVIDLSPGTDYLLRLIVTGGLHAGESNRVAVTTNSAEQPGGGGDEPEPEPEPEPDPVIVGVLDGQIYASYVTPERAEGRTIVSAALVKDGEEDEFYELGDEIRESGSYELTVTDDSQSRTTIRFTLVPDAQLTVINDEQYQVAYNTRDHMLSIPVHVVNAGADYAGAVNGVKLNAPGLAKDVDMLTVEYGNSGSGPYAYFYLYREPGTDHFSGTFPPYPYTLTGGWDENVTYSVQLLPSLTDRTIRVDAWVAFEQDSSQEHAIASIQTVNLIAEADPLAPISDLEVLYTSDTTTYASYTMPLLATEVNLEISEDDGETWQNAQTDSPVTPDASFVQVLGLNPGTAYRLRLSVADGVNAGQSNEVIFTTEPEDHT